MKHIHIDGSEGEGGGQVLRSSLALSLVTGRPFTIDHIRAKRKNPGLMRQHLTSVQAAANIGQCEVENVKVGSMQLDFRPKKIKGGEYNFNIGTAGSAILVLQTVLPALMIADEPSMLTLRGGTHNPMAPPFDFLQKVYLPLVNRLGPKIDAKLIKHGFYPAGGGEFQVRIEPVKKIANLELTERGEFHTKRTRILCANLPNHIPERERDQLLSKTHLDESQIDIEYVSDSKGPGNLVMLELIAEKMVELFCGFGERGVRAETVSNRVIDQYHRYFQRNVPVGEYLADQLLLPLGIAAYQGSGSSVFHTLGLTRHSLTHIEILRRFLEIDIQVEEMDHDKTCVHLQ